MEDLIKKYPKIVFNNIHLGKDDKDNYFGLIIDKSQILIGFYLPQFNKETGNSKGATPPTTNAFFKISKPISVGNELRSLLAKVPIVKGLTQNEMDYLTDTIKGSNTQILDEDTQLKFFSDYLKKSVNCEYDYFFDPKSKQCVKIHKNLNFTADDHLKLQEFAKSLQSENNDLSTKLIEKDRLNTELSNELLNVNESKTKVVSELTNKNTELSNELLNVNESKTKEQSRFNEYSKEFKKQLNNLKADYGKDLANFSKYSHIAENKLREWEADYNKLKAEFDKSKQDFFNGQVLLEQLGTENNKLREELQYKNEIIQKIRKFAIEWKMSLQNKEIMTNEELIKLRKSVKRQELIINSAFEKLYKCQDSERKHNLNTSQIDQLKAEIDRIVSEQKVMVSKYINEVNDSKTVITEKENEIVDLKTEMANFKKLVVENENALKTSFLVSEQERETSCKKLHENLLMLNNIFWRKLEMISELKNMIKNKSVFFGDNGTLKRQFEKVSQKINVVINFLNLNKYLNISNLKLNTAVCQELQDTLNYWEMNKADFTKQDLFLNFIFQVVSGKPTFYFKLKSKTNTQVITITNPENDPAVFIKCSNKKTPTEFKIFKKVFDENSDNLNIYQEVNKSIEFLSNGFSTTLINYGTAGSGKPFVLYGNEWNKGLIHYIQEGITEKGGTIILKDVWQLKNNLANKNSKTLNGKIHLLLNSRELERHISKKFIIDERKKYTEFTNDSSLNLDKFQSEDSWVFFNFTCKFGDKNVNFVIIDAPNISSPEHVFKSNLKTEKIKMSDVMYAENDKYLKRYTENPKQTFNQLKNSFFVNETLVHLGYYFKKLGNKPIHLEFNKDFENYSTDKVFVSPKKEFKGKINEFSNCLIIPIFNAINTKMTQLNNFVFLCNATDEEVYCNETVYGINKLNFN